MKILFLAPFSCTHPLQTNTVRTYHWLKNISLRHEVTFVHFVDPGKDAVLPDGLCHRSVAIVRRPKSGLAARAKNLLSRSPYFLGDQFRSEEMTRTVAEVCRAGSFDVVHCNSLAMSQYVPPACGRVTVLDGVDCNARNNLQQVGFPLGIRNRILAWLDWRKLKEYEPDQYYHFDAGLLASPQDRDFLLRLNGRLPLHVLPNGVDLEYFSPEPRPALEKRMEVLFAGPLNYPPNRDAVGFFCREVLPLILKKRPETVFRVLGNTAGGESVVRWAAAKNVIFSGHVPDVRPFIAAAGAVVCPLRMGTGIKTKVLEAMAMGKALVMTPVAAEGVRVSAGKDYLCATSPGDMAEALLKVLSDSELASKLGALARKAAEDGHDWGALSCELERIYESVLRYKK